MDDAATLQQTIAVVSRLREENAEYRRNFIDLQGAHEALAEAHERVSRELAAARAEALQAELATQETFSRLRAELESKGSEFEALASQVLAPHELDLLRLRLAEEIEAPWLAKLRGVEAELERGQAAYAKLKREYELQLTRANLDITAAAAELGRVRDTTQAAIRKEHARAEAAVAEARASMEANPDAQVELGRLRRRNAELEARVSALQRELGDVQARAGDATADARMEAANMAAALAARTDDEAASGAALEAARRRVRDLQADLTGALAANAELESRLESLAAQEVRARSAAAAEAHAAETAAKGLRAQFAEAEASWARTRAELQAEIDALREHNEHVSASARSALDRAAAKEAGLAKKIAAATVAAQEKEAFLAQTKEMLTQRLDEVTALREAEAKSRSAATEALMARAHDAESTATHAQSDLALARERINRLTGELADAHAHTNALDKTRGSLEVQIHSLQAANTELERRLADSMRAASEARLRTDAWESDKRALLTALIKVKTKYAGLKKKAATDKAAAKKKIAKASRDLARTKEHAALLASRANTASLHAASLSYTAVLSEPAANASENAAPASALTHPAKPVSPLPPRPAASAATRDLVDNLDAYSQFQTGILTNAPASLASPASPASSVASEVASELADFDDDSDLY